MTDFEKLGAFYIGRRRDPDTGETTNHLALYDSSDLVTHGLIVGMTGSGKTGLGVALVEEAAIDGVPAIVIDPKGDLTNLLLAFPSLAADAFQPWINEDDAARSGTSVEAYAASEAQRWRGGLAAWGEDGARIRRLCESADFTVYTPGSTAGVPVSVLGSFAPPRSSEPEVARERLQSTVSGLLALLGIESDPLKSREHILLSTIIADAWQRGVSPDLASLVHGVQQPPVERIGVIDVDSFYPPKDRFELAMTINALIAAPGFDVWTTGQSLDLDALLRTPTGKPRVAIFTIAHLDDRERMFFVTQLLSAAAGWMREQRGTSSLRALIYMDEIAGFFPPVANPPSKQPLLTLLKQGRAAGLGVVLATQNPADLDYKGLSNIGTWFLGRLQTERDKMRVLEGLEGSEAGGMDRSDVDNLLSRLSSRVFLMRNVHEPGLTLFETRWTLSYLRGPLSRAEIKRLTGDRSSAGQVEAMRSKEPAAAKRTMPSRTETADAHDRTTTVRHERPVVPPGVPQFFAPGPSGAQVLWRPAVYGAVQVRFSDRSLKLKLTRTLTLMTEITDGAVPVDWHDSVPTDLEPDQLLKGLPGDGQFEALPVAAANAKQYPVWRRQLAAWVTDNETLELLRSPAGDVVSTPDESERDFRSRVQQAMREQRDRDLEKLRRKYAPKQAALAEKRRRAEHALEKESEQASGQRLQTAISFGATVMGALLGRKLTAGTVGRATTAARGIGRSMKEVKDVERARESIAAVEEARRRLEEAFEAESATIVSPAEALTEVLEPVVVSLKKSNVRVKVAALVWVSE